MSTWCGAIVELRGRDVAAFAARNRITLSGPHGAWALLQGDVNLAHIEPPRFARELSLEVGGAVIAFMLQTTASCEAIEHWERGELRRRLVCEDGRWTVVEGTPQSWEKTYFFDDAEGTAPGGKWPHELDDDVSDEDRRRYEEAKRAGDPSPVLDLLRGGSVWPMNRLMKSLGLDPRAPSGHYTVPANWKPWAVLAVIVAFVVGSGLLGALTR